MAESAKTCIGCGLPLKAARLTVNGDAYHHECWDRSRPVPKARPESAADQARPSGDSATAD